MEVSGDNYSFELPDITTPNSHIALCFMDSVGNVSQVYWLDKIDGGGNDWWITDHTLTAADISISSSPATFPGKNQTATLMISNSFVKLIQKQSACIRSQSLPVHTQATKNTLIQ